MLHALIQWINADDLLYKVRQKKMHPHEAQLIIHNRVLLQIITVGLLFIIISQLILSHI